MTHCIPDKCPMCGYLLPARITIPISERPVCSRCGYALPTLANPARLPQGEPNTPLAREYARQQAILDRYRVEATWQEVKREDYFQTSMVIMILAFILPPLGAGLAWLFRNKLNKYQTLNCRLCAVIGLVVWALIALLAFLSIVFS